MSHNFKIDDEGFCIVICNPLVSGSNKNSTPPIETCCTVETNENVPAKTSVEEESDVEVNVEDKYLRFYGRFDTKKSTEQPSNLCIEVSVLNEPTVSVHDLKKIFMEKLKLKKLVLYHLTMSNASPNDSDIKLKDGRYGKKLENDKALLKNLNIQDGSCFEIRT